MAYSIRLSWDLGEKSLKSLTSVWNSDNSRHRCDDDDRRGTIGFRLLIPVDDGAVGGGIHNSNYLYTMCFSRSNVHITVKTVIPAMKHVDSRAMRSTVSIYKKTPCYENRFKLKRQQIASASRPFLIDHLHRSCVASFATVRVKRVLVQWYMHRSVQPSRRLTARLSLVREPANSIKVG